jgi:choline-sulfatase
MYRSARGPFRAFARSLLLGGGLLTAAPAVAADRPNIILMIWDTTRADHLSLYGHDRPTTPALDRIASKGAVFSAAQSSGYWTLPAAASLFTGLFTHNHNVDYASYQTKEYSLRLPEQATTLAEAFQAAGYRTGMFNASKIITDNESYQQGFDVFEFTGEETLAQKSLDFIGASDDKPYFIVMWYLTPHAPYEPGAPFDKWVKPGMAPVNISGCSKAAVEAAPPGYTSQCAVNKGEVVLQPEQWDQLERMYDGEILRNDTVLDGFWKKLEAAGETKDLVFAFTSDHGEAFNDHESEKAWHNMPYENNQNVPLVLRYPGKVPAGRFDTAVRTMDLYPTLLELAGAPPAGGLNAASLMPLVSGAQSADRPNMGANHGGLHWYFDGKHKLLYIRKNEAHPFHRPELYDHGTDPEEKKNIAVSNAELADKVHRQALAFLAATTLSVGEGAEVDAEQLELLRQMGYIE